MLFFVGDKDVPYDARVVRIMIASPGDVRTEREIIRDVIYEWNYINSEERGLVLLPLGWETHSTPEMGDRPQAIINKQLLDRSDILVAVFWTKIGTSTGEAISGTVEELQKHVGAGKTAMLYFSEAQFSMSQTNTKQLDAIEKFKKECQSKGLYAAYQNVNEFRTLISRHLSQKIIQYYPLSTQEIKPTPKPTFLISDDSIKLLRAAANSDGRIFWFHDLRRKSLEAGGVQFLTDQMPRSAARAESWIEELQNRDFIRDRGNNQQSFEVTESGYSFLEGLDSPA